MIDQPMLQLLRDCRRQLRYPGLRFFSNIALARRIDDYLTINRASARYGSSVIAHARGIAATVSGVTVDADETEIRPHPEGFQVKAWLLVPAEVVASLDAIDPSLEIAFARLDRWTREVLILRVRQGLDVDEIASRLSISRRGVRRRLRVGIEAIAKTMETN